MPPVGRARTPLDETRRRRARRLLGWVLWTWPARHRTRLGASLVDTAAEMVAERGDAGAWSAAFDLAAEVIALFVAGLRLRRADVGASLTEWTVDLGRDVRFAWRAAVRSPAFTAVVVLALGIGIGANGAVFSLVEGVLLRPPAYAEPERLVVVWNRLPDSGERIPVAGPDAAEIEGSVGSFSSVGFLLKPVDGAVESAAGGPAHHVRISTVTPDFFVALGVAPLLGRSFVQDDAPGSAGADATLVLVTHDLYRRVLGGDPARVGEPLTLNGRSAVVAGVLPPDFSLALSPSAGFATDIDVWVPLSVPLSTLHRTDGRLLDQDSDNSGAVVARLAPGASIGRARAELGALAARLADEVPLYAEAELGFDVRALHDDATAHARPVLVALMMGVGGVLLVACLNIATLTMVRSSARRPEFAVRACLGAGRGRLVRQLLLEGTVLVAMGLVVAAAMAWWGLELLSVRVPASLAPSGALTLEPRTLLFMAGLGGGAVVAFGIVPALDARAAVAPGRRIRRGHGRGRGALVAVEVALSVAMVFGAALLVRTVDALSATDPGFQPDHALAFQVSLRVPERYRGPAERAAYAADIQRSVEALPGVDRVGWVGVLPLSGERWTQPYGLPGDGESEWRRNRADFRVASSGYFEAVGASLLDGRAFAPEEDREERSRVVVVDEHLARRIAPDGSPVGSAITIPLDGARVEARVVGVVGAIRSDRLDAVGRGAVYVPYRQEASRDVAFVVRTVGDPANLALAVRDAVLAVDPGIPPYDVRTLASYVDEAMSPRRFALFLLVGFAALALACAAVGLYGVVAFDAGRRTGELGVRMAVGAGRRDVLRSVVGSGLRPGAIGLGAGLVVGVAVAGFFRELAYQVDVHDPALWASVLLVVGAVTALATAVPAWRASRLSPVEALRTE